MRRATFVAAATAAAALVGLTAVAPLPTAAAPVAAPAAAAIDAPAAEATDRPGPDGLHGEGIAPDTSPVPARAQQVPEVAAPDAAKDRNDVGLVPTGGRRSSTDRVVEVRHDGDAAAVTALVEGLGGRVHGPAGGHALEATVARAAIDDLWADPHVTEVASPTLATAEAGTATTGEEVGFTNANDWQQAGINGAGVKVGIIDTFSSSKWNAARASGDVPAATGTFCRWAGSSCDIWAGGQHGVAVAEIVYEMAPGVQLYLATVGTAADFQAAINYFAAQGVKVVTRSETAEYDGRGNGSGPLADVVASAVSKGMVYLNSAGNSAGGSGTTGSYWRGSWSDSDGDGYLNFNGSDELLRTRCWYFNGLRWNDWGTAASRTDYDVFLYNDAGTQVLGGSQAAQQSGASPIERLNTIPCTANTYVNVAIYLYDAGSGTAGDTLELMVNGVGVEYWSNPYSASGPMSDSASTGMLTVGAIDPAAGVTIAPYSSWGPTNDNRTKPDVAAVACVSSASYAPNCFNGTSAATPVVAGAVALAWATGAFTTPTQVASYIKGQTVDRGTAGTDNVYGRGEVILDAPTSPSPYSSWTAFITRQFNDLVGRAPTVAERQRWAYQLSLGGGQTPAGLVASLRGSNENATNVDPVARLYWAYFLRIPDRDGLNYWIGRRRGGTSLSTISQNFAASAEFRTLYGTLNNAQFVNLVYQNVLGRAGEADGVAFWVSELSSGRRTRGSVMTGFSESAEYKTKMRGSVDVAVITSALLRRKPTTAEVNARKAQTTLQIAQWALGQASYVKP